MEEIILMTGYRCNLRCPYCPLEKDGPTMADAAALRALDLFLDDRGRKKVRFFGGETLLNFELVRRCVRHAGKGPRYEINTNSYLLDRDKLGFLKKYDFELIISFDFLNKKNLAVFKLLKEEKVLDKATFTLVAAPETVDDLEKNFSALIGRGAKKIHILPVFYTKIWPAGKIKRLEEAVLKIAAGYRAGRYFLEGVVDLEDELRKRRASPRKNLFIDTDGSIFYDDLVLLLPRRERGRFKAGDIGRIGNFSEISGEKKLELEGFFPTKAMLNKERIKSAVREANQIIEKKNAGQNNQSGQKMQ